MPVSDGAEAVGYEWQLTGSPAFRVPGGVPGSRVCRETGPTESHIARPIPDIGVRGHPSTMCLRS